MQYVWLGDELGGRPQEASLYTSDGRVRYDLVAATDQFNDGLRRLRKGIKNMRVAVMCSEEDPEHCHRRLLVARVLSGAGVEILHIRRTGRYTLDDLGFGQPARVYLLLSLATPYNDWHTKLAAAVLDVPSARG